MTGTNYPYSNFFLSNEIEDQFNSRLDLQQFCKIDRGLEGVAGMVRKINVYRATDGTEDLGIHLLDLLSADIVISVACRRTEMCFGKTGISKSIQNTELVILPHFVDLGENRRNGGHRFICHVDHRITDSKHFFEWILIHQIP